MIIFLIIGLLLGGLAVIFALQNLITITVTFLAWDLTGSLALILLLAVATGVVISVLFSLPTTIRTGLRISGLQRQNNKLKDELENTRTTHHEVMKEVVKSQQSTVIQPDNNVT
ncbi:LapA family protein [Patescibacteria group bacterium]|nr:LapA family protein [Patescibacteria group bacterium]